MSEKPAILILADYPLPREGLIALAEKETSWIPQSGLLSHPPERDSCSLVVAVLHSSLVAIEPTVRRLMRRYSGCPVVLLGPPLKPETMAELVALGIRGYLSRDSEFADLRQAVDLALHGHTVLDRRVGPGLLRTLAAAFAARPQGAPVVLTSRQREIARAVVQTGSYGQAAHDLHIERDSVRKEWSRIRQAIAKATPEEPREYILRHL